GAFAYLLPTLWVLWLSACGRLTGLGLGTPVSPRTVVVAVLAGAGLASHLLISASRTLGVQVRVDHVSDVLAASAYALVPTVRAALAVVTRVVALEGAGPSSLLRHVYLLPVLAAALRFGAGGGALAAMGAVLLSAPFVLPEIERSGLTTEAVEGLVTFAVLGLVGVMSGVLRTRAGRHRRRYEILVAIQRTLAGEAAPD